LYISPRQTSPALNCFHRVGLHGRGIHFDDPSFAVDEDRQIVHRLRQKAVLAKNPVRRLDRFIAHHVNHREMPPPVPA